MMSTSRPGKRALALVASISLSRLYVRSGMGLYHLHAPTPFRWAPTCRDRLADYRSSAPVMKARRLAATTMAVPCGLRRTWRFICIGRRYAAVSRSRPSGQLDEELTRPLSGMTGNVSLAIKARMFRAEAASTGSVPGIIPAGNYRTAPATSARLDRYNS